MNHYFTKTFYKFLAGFVLIIVAAFGTLMILGSRVPGAAVDNTAQAQ